jgi:hypothetical protein
MPINPSFHFHHISNKKLEPGKKSRPGKPLKSKTQLPACIAFTFYSGGGYLRCIGE